MLIENIEVEIKIHCTQRKYYENILKKKLKNGEVIKVMQKDLPFSTRTSVYFNCDICDEIYKAPRNTQKKEGDSTYCSKDCHKEGKRIKLKNNNPNPPKDKINVQCFICKKDIYVFPSKFRKQEYFTCSRECYKKRREMKGFNLLNKETSPEKKIREFLELKDISYETQKSVYPYWGDFYLKNHNIIIEVYGDYWHCNPMKYGYEDLSDIQYSLWVNDCKRINEIISKGYNVLIIWERDINLDFKKVKKYILSHLKK